VLHAAHQAACAEDLADAAEEDCNYPPGAVDSHLLASADGGEERRWIAAEAVSRGPAAPGLCGARAEVNSVRKSTGFLCFRLGFPGFCCLASYFSGAAGLKTDLCTTAGIPESPGDVCWLWAYGERGGIM